METEQQVRIWRAMIPGREKSWVLFRHGTCVVVPSPGPDLAADARKLLSSWGPVRPACSAGDFSVITPLHDPGRVVTCHHPDILTYVGAEEMAHDRMEVVGVGLLGRSRRDQDARELEVVHVEDRRSPAQQ